MAKAKPGSCFMCIKIRKRMVDVPIPESMQALLDGAEFMRLCKRCRDKVCNDKSFEDLLFKQMQDHAVNIHRLKLRREAENN